MLPTNLIKKIENNHNIYDILSNELPIWQYIRNLLYNQILFSNQNNTSNRIKDFYYLIRNCNWGNQSKLNPYKYLLFTDLNEQKIYNDKYIDKTAQNLIDLIHEDLLIIINPSGRLHNASSQYLTNHMSSSFFHYKRWTLGLEQSASIKNEEILTKILRKYNVVFDVNYYNRLFFTYTKIFSEWLPQINPQAVFVNCHYSLFHQALIYVCKKNKIKTIEMQHGLISKSHSQYCPQRYIGTDTFPDYILTYGHYVKNIINKHFIHQQKIIPIGHCYLEKILNHNSDNVETLSSQFESYEKIIVVSSQNDIENELLKTIEKIAFIKSDILFIIKLRNSKKIFFNLKNMCLENDTDIYELLKFADLHISCYSTTALEASMLGTPTILININNRAKLYYESIRMEFRDIKICESEHEAIDLIDTLIKEQNSNKPYILNNKENIKQFLDNHISNENSLHIS